MTTLERHHHPHYDTPQSLDREAFRDEVALMVGQGRVRRGSRVLDDGTVEAYVLPC